MWRPKKMADFIESIHAQVRQLIEAASHQYKVGNYVWAISAEDHVLVGVNNKMWDKEIAPCEKTLQVP